MKTMMKTLHVQLEDRSYPIYLGEGLLDQPDLIARHVNAKQVMIVTNETVALFICPKQRHCFPRAGLMR